MFTTLLLQPLASGLIVFYRLLGSNMGLAIIVFSLVLRLILNPLTKPYMESMSKIKEYAPELEKLKKKYKNDKVKFAQAQSDFYKTKGINPSAGCLPYLLQIVVLIAFFNVFTRTLSAGGDLAAKFNELLYPSLQFKAGEVVNTSFLYLDVSKPDTFSVPGIPFSLPGPILILAAITQLISAKISAPFIEQEKKIAKKTKSETDDLQVAMQQSMIYTFPLITIVIGLNFASGLALYWLMFSLSQAYQQFRSQGWGGMTPWVRKIGIATSKGK